ncbi:MAG: hypothetical protein AB8C95_10465 [Phycisphaeraceae bacterium]
MDRDTDPTSSPRKRPSRFWYLLSAVVLLASAALFALVIINKSRALHDRIEPLPRFVGPTDEAGFVMTVMEPGKQNIFYENLGTLGDQSFDTPRRQVWTTFDAPAMTCVVTHIESGEVAEVRMPGTAESPDKREITKDLIVAYDFNGRQGHSAWVFEADQVGEYRIVLKYDEAVYRKPSEVDIPAELTKAEKRTMNSTEGAAYEQARREIIEQAALAELEPIDVLFAVGPDPTVGSFFEVIGLKGAATVLAFGFTFAALTSLVTLMLRGGHVTPRGEMEHVQRLGKG